MANGTRRRWGVSITPRPLFTPGKDPVPIVQEAGWAPGPVWTGEENLAPTGIRSPDRPARSQSLSVAIPPELPGPLAVYKELIIWTVLILTAMSPATDMFVVLQGRKYQSDATYGLSRNMPVFFLDKNVVDCRWLVISKMLVGTNNRPKLNLVIFMPS